jgi:cytochrome P450 family 135
MNRSSSERVLRDGCGPLERAVSTPETGRGSGAVNGRAELPPGPRLPRRLQTMAFALAPLRFIEACHRRYGAVVQFRTLEDPRFVMVFEPRLVKQVFGEPSQRLQTAEFRARLAPLVGDSSVLMLDGAEHMTRRRVVLRPLHGELMRAHAGAIQDATDRAVDSWPTGQPFALLPSMRSLTLEAMMATVFGPEPSRGRDELKHRLTALLLRFRLGSPHSGDFRAHLRLVDGLIYETISGRRRAADLARRPDVLSLLLLARDENGQAMTDQELRNELVGLLFAGHETTPIALAWAFELLFRHHEVLERLETELANGELGYLDAVVRESLRLRPPVVQIGRIVHGEPCELGGYRLQPGTEIRVPIAAIHRHAEQYPEPHDFRPERFLGSDAPDTYTWLAFGGGVHRCLGASFATFAMSLIVSRVLERTRLASVGRRPEKAMLDESMQVPARGARVVKLRSGSRRTGRFPARAGPV